MSGKMNHRVFCGIEGGSTSSKLVLVDDAGNVLCWLDGQDTNHLLIGLDACQKRIVEMIKKCKEVAGLPPDMLLEGLGLCMSGCEVEEDNRNFEKLFLENYPNITKHCHVASDTLGSIFTASPKGGLVLIAGTGSNALLINPDGSTARCGGWGHLLGDEGSAMWISLKAVKTVFDAEDNYVPCQYDISRVKQLILEHFNVTDKFGVLSHCYVNFNKRTFAGLCAKLAEAAEKENDELCLNLFYEAGKAIGKSVVAVSPKVQETLKRSDGGLPIVCVGSVFKSWSLLHAGFKEVVEPALKEYTLFTLNCSSAIGTAYLGAKVSGFELPLDFVNNCSILYHYK